MRVCNYKGKRWRIRLITKRNFLTHSEIESLLKAANTGPHAARNYCLTLLCFIHGFRASEICRLRISDIDLKAKCIYIHRLKRLFNNAPAIEQRSSGFKNWLSIRTSYPHAESEWVFLSRKGNPLSRQQFYHIISTSGGNAGLSLEIHPHMLRHSCGFALANMGIDTRLIELSWASQYSTYCLVYRQQCRAFLRYLG